MGSYPYPRNGIIKIDYEFILLFKKIGKPPKPTAEQKKQSKLTNEEWNQYFSGHWNFPGEKQNGGHIAMFPLELPYRLIKMFSFVNETVLDPFCGSGTTTLASINLNRNSIGYEINKDFKPIIENRIGFNDGKLFGNKYSVEFFDQPKVNIEKSILPYRFVDTVKFDKKIDPRELTFGSIITCNEKKNEKITVQEVLSPDKILLSTGQLVKLLGVKPNPKKKNEAINFIRKLSQGHNISLRFDEIMYDSDNNLLAYLYLKNKTFVNAHLIKSKLVFVDMEKKFRYKDKFEKLYQA